MTEQEWLSCSDPELMLKLLRGKASDRKIRLYGVACQRIWMLHPDDQCRHAIEVGARFADNATDDVEIASAWKHVHDEWVNSLDSYTHWTYATSIALATVAKYAWGYIAFMSASEAARSAEAEEEPEAAEMLTSLAHAQPDLLREIIGNPFREVALEPSWLTTTVVSLARGIYVERAWERMSLLGDAMMDADCENDEILGHCRIL